METAFAVKRDHGTFDVHILMTVNAAWNIWNFRRPLVEALAGEGHRLTVLAPPDDAVRELERLGCRIRLLKMSVKGLNPIEDLKLQRRFGRIFREERPDAVLSYTIKNNIFGARAAKAAGVPFLPNVTGLGTAFLSGRLLQTLTEQLYRRSFAELPIVFFQNGDDRDLFLERRLVQSDQARLLPGSGIDLRHFASAPMPAPGAPPVFLMIARLLRDKGVAEFVEAARRVRARQPHVRFQLLGAVASENRTAIDHPTLEALVAEGVVEYLGTTTDVRPPIAASTCVVLPSYREGAPRTLIEAAAMARPLIATDVPGCRAVVDRDRSGFLCDARSADSLVTAIERFLALPPATQEAMGVAGRVKMEREYDQALVVDAYRNALEVVASGRRGLR
jgi:glycosyltransferase involved in cell wall biosynthesis